MTPILLACWMVFVTSAVLAFPAMTIAAPPPMWERPSGWTATRGGEGGRVIEVTTLAAAGPGSLAAALADQGRRTIVFQVGGVIDLAGGRLSLRHPHATIAGETAPSPGITIIRGGLGISAHDVIVRHIRVRVGEAGRAKESGWEVDGIATNAAHDVIVDHCSVSWATDENVSASGPRFDGADVDQWRENTSRRITFSHCLIAEALHRSTHSKGPHSMGSLIHDNTSDILILGNLYLSNNARNPLFKGGARGAIINNLVHNPGGGGPRYGLQADEWVGHEWERGALVIVGNVVRQGPSSAARISFATFRGPCDAYLQDNLLFDRAGKALPIEPRFVNQAGQESAQPAPGEFRALTEPPFWPPELQARPAREVAEWVLANVGARPWDRDVVDRRLIDETRAGRGTIIDSENEVGGYAILSAGPAAKVNRGP